MSPNVSTMANVWTASEAISACAHRATLANAVREMSMNVCQTPVIPEGHITASSSPTATDVNAALDTQVRDVIRCLMDVKEDPAEMEEHVL